MKDRRLLYVTPIRHTNEGGVLLWYNSRPCDWWSPDNGFLVQWFLVSHCITVYTILVCHLPFDSFVNNSPFTLFYQ